MKYVFSLLLMLCLAATTAGAQNAEGKDFWFTYLDNDLYCRPPFDTMKGIWWDDTVEVYITSKFPATIEISTNPDFDKPVFTRVKLKPNVPFRYQLPSEIAARSFFSEIVVRYGVHITSNWPISVTASNRYWGSKGSTVVMPTESIPENPEYYVTTNEGSNYWVCFSQYTGKPFKSQQFNVVCISDYAEVEIVPMGKSSTVNNIVNRPIVARLTQGQVFVYTSGDIDLTGSVIRSRTPGAKFAVFAGNRLTYSSLQDSINNICQTATATNFIKEWMPDLNMKYLDHTYEQMIPTVAMGKRYTALPFKNTRNYYLKILAVEDNTRIYINGTYNTTLNQSESMIWNVNKDTATTVSSEKRISVTQFTKSVGCNGHPGPYYEKGDVSQLQLTPNELTADSAIIHKAAQRKKYLWSFWDGRWEEEFFFNVLVNTKDTGFFRINGKAVPVNQWRKTQGLKSYLQFTMTDSMYTLKSPKGFIAYNYSHGLDEGDAYAATANFGKLRPDFYTNVQCLKDTTDFQVASHDTFFTNFQWKVNNKIYTGEKLRHVALDTGYHSIALYYTDIRTNTVDSIVKRLYFGVGSPMPILANDTMICGRVDINLFCRNFEYSNYYKWEDGREVYYRNLKQPGLYWVNVTSRNGCSTRDTFNIVNHPFPKANFSVSDTEFCLNAYPNVKFVNKSTTKDTIVRTVWDFGDKSIADSTRVLYHMYTKPNLYMVVLSVTSIHDCRHDTFALINVLPSPKASFTITHLDSCFRGNNISYKNTTVIDTALHQRFKWYFSEGYVISNSNPATPRKYTLPGQYVTNLIYQNKNGCIDTFKRNITIYEEPKPDFILSNPLLCSKDSVHFINNTSSLYKPVKVKWEFGDGGIDSAYDPVHLYKQRNIYTVKLSAVNPQGCRDTIAKPVKIFGSPKVGLKLRDTAMCFNNNNFLLISSSTSDTGKITGQLWRFSDRSQQTGRDTVNKSFNTSGAQWVQLRVDNIFGCSDSITVPLMLYPHPQAAFTVNDAGQCFKAQDYDFDYTVLPGNGIISKIKWYTGSDSMTGVSQIADYRFKQSGLYPVRLELYSDKGCKGTDTKMVNVFPSPKAKIYAPLISQCFSGNGFMFYDSSSIQPGKISYQYWDFGDTTTSLVKNPPLKRYRYSGDYTVRLITESDSGCRDTTTQSLKIFPGSGTKIDPILPVCLNDSSAFGASVANGKIISCQWWFGDNALGYQPVMKHVYPRAGYFNVAVKIVTDNNCKDSILIPNGALVYSLPNPKFSHLVTALDTATEVSFSDITQPTPVKLLWDFGEFGKSILPDTAILLKDSATINARLRVTDANGCSNTAYGKIFASVRTKVIFPTAFTPNGDGLNDGFGPQGVLVARKYSLKIYNRWGEKVFDSENPAETWDGTYMGKKCPAGAFIYILKVTDYRNQDKMIRGTVTLLW